MHNGIVPPARGWSDASGQPFQHLFITVFPRAEWNGRTAVVRVPLVIVFRGWIRCMMCGCVNRQNQYSFSIGTISGELLFVGWIWGSRFETANEEAV